MCWLEQPPPKGCGLKTPRENQSASHGSKSLEKEKLKNNRRTINDNKF
jgi:hypothetical protein